MAKLLRYDLAPSNPYARRNGIQMQNIWVRIAKANNIITVRFGGGKMDILIVALDSDPANSKGNETSRIAPPTISDPLILGGLQIAFFGDENRTRIWLKTSLMRQPSAEES